MISFSGIGSTGKSEPASTICSSICSGCSTAGVGSSSLTSTAEESSAGWKGSSSSVYFFEEAAFSSFFAGNLASFGAKVGLEVDGLITVGFSLI
jgi:hypothetical protein